MSFEENLELFRKRFPKEALYVESAELKELPSLSYTPDEEGDILVLSGIDDGSFYRSVKSWLKEDNKRHLLYVEEDFGKIRAFLEREHDALLDPSFSLVPFREDFFNVTTWRFLGARYQIVSDEPFKNALLQMATHKQEAMQEYLDFGIAYYRNFFPNLSSLSRASLATDHFHTFREETAIIVAAGPSLSRQLPLLKELQKRAYLFAGGSALVALAKSAILPDFALAIDPNPLLASRLASIDLGKTPLLYRLRLNREILPKIKGPLLYVSGSGGYETARYFEERLQIPPSQIDEGHNVINFATDLCRAFGFERILYVGLDLGFTGGHAYSKEIEESGSSEETILREDIYGKPLQTLWKWTKEAEWLTQFALEHPEIVLINATEGGLGFSGSMVLSLKEASLQLPAQRREVALSYEKKIDDKLLNESKIAFRESLLRAKEHLEALLNEEGAALLHQVELEEEIAWEFYLETFNSFLALKQSHQLIGADLKALQNERYSYLLRTVECGLRLSL